MSERGKQAALFPPPTHVYAVMLHGSEGSRQTTPLYATRKAAIAAMKERQRKWDEFEASGKGAIFGHMTIERLELER